MNFEFYECAVKWRAMEMPGPGKEWNDEDCPDTL
jgi:hypothetical protein